MLYDPLKRAMDVTLGGALLLLSLPLLVIAAVAVALTTREWPLLLQRRAGLGGQPFPMLKLRTMRGPDGAVSEHSEDASLMFTAKQPADPRVTRVGAFLRRTSIDELPQLVNVLAGHMSLVGPRPGLLPEVARYPAPWRRRLAVKPGLTGLWQVSGRSAVPARRRMAMDRCYTCRRSLLFDASIMLRTVAAVASMRGAW